MEVILILPRLWYPNEAIWGLWSPKRSSVITLFHSPNERTLQCQCNVNAMHCNIPIEVITFTLIIVYYKRLCPCVPSCPMLIYISIEGQVNIRWTSGECQVNVRWMSDLNLSLTLVDVKLVSLWIGCWNFRLGLELGLVNSSVSRYRAGASNEVISHFPIQFNPILF